VFLFDHIALNPNICGHFYLLAQRDKELDPGIDFIAIKPLLIKILTL
jgi:hypothetical protein